MINPEQLTHDVLALHSLHLPAFLQQEPPPIPTITSVLSATLSNHYFNCRLWREEDLARRQNVSDAEIVANKRAIDRYNQARNDAVERFDEYLLAGGLEFNEHAAPCSETPGAMVDRLSILALKQHHMALQATRSDVSPTQRSECEVKLERLQLQHSDLATCLQRLLTDCLSGTARFRVYRQFKMYNDPRYRSITASASLLSE